MAWAASSAPLLVLRGPGDGAGVSTRRNQCGRESQARPPAATLAGVRKEAHHSLQGSGCLRSHWLPPMAQHHRLPPSSPGCSLLGRPCSLRALSERIFSVVPRNWAEGSEAITAQRADLGLAGGGGLVHPGARETLSCCSSSPPPVLLFPSAAGRWAPGPPPFLGDTV